METQQTTPIPQIPPTSPSLPAISPTKLTTEIVLSIQLTPQTQPTTLVTIQDPKWCSITKLIITVQIPLIPQTVPDNTYSAIKHTITLQIPQTVLIKPDIIST